MKHLFVPYQLAKLAKEKGFNDVTLGYHEHTNGVWKALFVRYSYPDEIKENEIGAPLYQQLVDWFSAKHSIELGLDIKWYDFNELGENALGKGTRCYWSKVYSHGRLICHMEPTDNRHEALTAALTKAFELI